MAATAMQTAGTIVSGVNQAKASKYSAKVREQNAAMDRAAARDAVERGQIEEQKQYRDNAQRQGAQRAAMAANGIDVDFGSAAIIQDDAKRIGWMDAQTVRENARREVKGYEISAFNNDAGAATDRANAKSAMWSTVFDAGGTMLGGAQQYRKLKTKGGR